MSRLCPDCHATIWNEGAHAEACPGPLEFVGYQCARCLEVGLRGERLCPCGGLRHPVYGIKAKS